METMYYDDIQALTAAIALLIEIDADPKRQEFRADAERAALRKYRQPLPEAERDVLATGWAVMERRGWIGLNGWPRVRGLCEARERIETEEMQAALAHAERAELADNPGGDWITEAESELNIDADSLRMMEAESELEDKQALWAYRIWAKAWALRNADEAEHERQSDR